MLEYFFLFSILIVYINFITWNSRGTVATSFPYLIHDILVFIKLTCLLLLKLGKVVIK